jgi:hypothetical protein
MAMTKSIAQLRITRELSEAETALNTALLKQSQLFSTMLSARAEVGVSPILGQDALLRLAKAQQTLLAASSDLARVHGRLLEIGQDLDLIPMGEECPPDWQKPTGELAGQALAA